MLLHEGVEHALECRPDAPLAPVITTFIVKTPVGRWSSGAPLGQQGQAAQALDVAGPDGGRP